MAPEYDIDLMIVPPYVPDEVARQYKVHEPRDTRFRAAARLLQALWRIDGDLPIGSYTAADGTTRKLGSRISDSAGKLGANFLTPAIAQLARREVMYRETCAMIDKDRLSTNLLSSMPLTFNLLGILRLNLDLAARVLQQVFPDAGIKKVRGLWFEHSPGRGHVALTADHTAFDAIVLYETAGFKTGFIAFEVKYAESMWEPVPTFSARYDTLMPKSGLFLDPSDERLRKAPVQQLTREHCLAQAMLMRGDYDIGTFALVTPEFNGQVRAAGWTYEAMLAPVKKQAAFKTVHLEAFINAIEAAGEADYAASLRRRYTDWWSVDGAIEMIMDPPAKPPTTPPVALLPPPAAAEAATADAEPQRLVA